MTYTKLERGRYNEDRARKCKALGITKNQYNWLRRKGEELHKIYEDNCNGEINEKDYDRKTSELEHMIYGYIGKLGLFIYLQTDPRGATIYLDRNKIPENNYTQAICIY